MSCEFDETPEPVDFDEYEEWANEAFTYDNGTEKVFPKRWVRSYGFPV